MRRREFITMSGLSAMGVLAGSNAVISAESKPTAKPALRWQRHARSGLFQQVHAVGRPLVQGRKGPAAGRFLRFAPRRRRFSRHEERLPE